MAHIPLEKGDLWKRVPLEKGGLWQRVNKCFGTIYLWKKGLYSLFSGGFQIKEALQPGFFKVC